MSLIESNSRSEPHAEYTRRLEAWKSRLTEYEAHHRRIGKAQLALGLATLLLAVLALVVKLLSVFWALAPIVSIIVLAIIHDRMLKSRDRCSRTVHYYEHGLARIENRWMGTGDAGERFQDDSHSYSRDLDLFGNGSIFQLLCVARTSPGQETLARWLLAPATPLTVRARQQAVTDLRNRVDLREDLAVLEENTQAAESMEALAAWGENRGNLNSSKLRAACASLAILWVGSAIYWLVRGVAWPAILLSVINVSINLAFRQRVEETIGAVETAARNLSLLAGVLARVERENFNAPRLAELQAGLQSVDRSPSYWISRLSRLMDYLDSRRNLVVGALDLFILWSVQSACAVESWRRLVGPSIRGWLNAVGEIEALSSLAGYAYEHPSDVFPEFAETSPCFDAEDIAHPLLAEREAIRNDLRFNNGLKVLIISGPNMAGKSTFMRSVGVNSVLAQCGAPVRARKLRLSPLAVGASICVLDSLQGGVSKFYAEIKRLKQIVDLTNKPTAVLFLLDEFLGGTNSDDRRTGSEAMVRRLVEKGAIGLVTTHDLALTKIVDSLAPQAANAHFEDHLEDGKLKFYYRLEPGIVKSSNALALMRSIGLDV